MVADYGGARLSTTMGRDSVRSRQGLGISMNSLSCHAWPFTRSTPSHASRSDRDEIHDRIGYNAR
jgi:hypothetical protein